MDFTNALILLAVVMVVTDWVKSVIGTIDARLTPLVAMAIAIGAVFLVGATAWSHEQVIGGVSLSDMETADKLIVGLMIGGGAAFAKKTLTAVHNIGENKGSVPPTE